MKVKFLPLLICVLLFVTVGAMSGAGERTGSGTFNLRIDNDVFLLSFLDRNYTNGVRLTWSSPYLENFREFPLIRWLPFLDKPGFKHALSLSIGHNIYTPIHIGRSELQLNDHPYAGVLFLETGIHSRNSSRMDTLTLSLGIIGPAAFAREIQTAVHKFFKSRIPKGWDHQLKNEVALGVFYEQKRRMLLLDTNEGFRVELIPHLGLGVGNVYTYAKAGAQFRFGWFLPDDFGIPLIRPEGDANLCPYDGSQYPARSGPVGLYGFILFDGQAVARDIFLDGNSFQESHRVDKLPFIADFAAGVGLKAWRLHLSCAYISLTKQFRTQNGHHSFISFNLCYGY